MIDDIRSLYSNNKINPRDYLNSSYEKSLKVQKKHNAFITILDNYKLNNEEKGILSGIPYGCKDNFSTKGILTTASSNTLKNYVPIYDATCIKKLNEAGAVLMSKTSLDEFGMGGTGTTSYTGPVLNPWNPKRICGGSSSGSACSVASGVYPFALGTDTGDSIRKPASFTGIVGYKPTYGMISRYGILPYASSFDTVGVLTRCVKDAAIVVDVMKGKDEHDLTSIDSSNINLEKSLENNNKHKKICILKEVMDLSSKNILLNKHINYFENLIKKFVTNGYEVDEVSIGEELLKVLPSVYACITNAEATSNMSNLVGIPFGPLVESENIFSEMKKFRTENFSSLIKRRFVIGSYVLQKENQEKYFLKAKKVRRLIVDKMNDIFKKYDALVLPTSSAPLLENVLNGIESDLDVLNNHLLLANMGGFPSINIPSGFIDELPIGINITGKCYDDEVVLNIASEIENLLEYKGQIAKEGKNV